MIGFLLLTALVVSLDALAYGISASHIKKRKLAVLLIITLTVFSMCVFTNYFAVFLSATILKKTACIGGVVLIAIGVFNLVKKDSVTDGYERGKGLLAQSLITGVVLGLDGAFANLSLSLMGSNALYVPLTIAVMHAVMIVLGFALSYFPPFKRVLSLNFIPPVILIALGVIKLLGLFI